MLLCTTSCNTCLNEEVIFVPFYILSLFQFKLTVRSRIFGFGWISGWKGRVIFFLFRMICFFNSKKLFLILKEI